MPYVRSYIMKNLVVFITILLFCKIANAHDSLWVKQHTAMLNKPFPKFSKKDLNNKLWNNGSIAGKVTLVSCWKVGCLPCMDEASHLKAFADSFKRNGFQLISFARNNKAILASIMSDTTKDKDLLWYRKYYSCINFPIIPCCKNPELEKWDRTDCAFLEKDLKIMGYPTVLLVDKKGIIRYMDSGFPSVLGNDKEEKIKAERNIVKYFAALKIRIEKLQAE
jgi:thiol-disulfide isomerase/thioredoxin